MSLRVWLPLNGSLENKGLDDITPVLTGAVAIDNEGKIGKCYKFGTSLGRITIPPTVMHNYTECSVAFWVNILGWQTNWDTFFQAGLGNAPWNNYIFGVLRNQSNHVVFAISDGSTSSQGYYKSSDLTLNTWYHLAFTYKTGHCCIYVNGILFKDYATTIVPKFSNITYVSIGQLGNAGSYQTNCKMNDFRIYDHALSPFEVKEISQGLVLHYSLNRNGWGQENLIVGYDTSFLSYSDGAVTLFNNQMNGGAQEIVSNIGGAIKCLHLHSNGGNGRQYRMLNATSGKSYTISCDYYSTSSQAFPFRGELNGGNYSWAGSNAAAYTTPNKWVRLSFSYLNLTSDATIYYFMQCSQNTDCYIKNLKIEEGSIATPWCPNSSDELYNTLGLNDNIEYDVSGYCNNGEYYAYDTNGSISYTSDTPKYNVSTHIASANPTQHAVSGTRYLYGHCKLTNPTQMSVAFWLKPITGGYGSTTSNGQGYFCTTNYEYGDTSVGSDYQDSAMNHRDGTVDMNDSASTTQCRVTFYSTIGEWHHYVYTYDGQVGRGYKDGVQTATAQFSAAKTLDSFIGVVIGFSKAGGVWRRNDACYSDFRVYATALSADDVKSLYQNSAYIDNQGNIYGAVYEEV